MCEELEYSDLIDKAVQQTDAHMRMVVTYLIKISIHFSCFYFQVLITCFAISRYAATNSRGQRKPFNPLEGETFENKRDDMGWNYISEQVMETDF